MKRSEIKALAKRALGPKATVEDSSGLDGIFACTGAWTRGVFIYFGDKKLREEALVAALEVLAKKRSKK